ncbi:MAG: GNAT family N-acetyltransferase [Candidatus Neomarinimicrobiota bacterium]
MTTAKLRYRYFLELQGRSYKIDTLPTGFKITALQPDCYAGLSELLIAAFHGTIDDEGETPEQAVVEIQDFLDGQRGGPPMFAESAIGISNGQIIGASMVANWTKFEQPIITYMMIHPQWQKQGLGKLLLRSSLTKIKLDAHERVWAIITKGNIGSETLFQNHGFKQDTEFNG